MDMEPSESQHELRNDGRSVHHRRELEKEFAVIAEKIAELKADVEFELRPEGETGSSRAARDPFSF